MTSGLDGSLLYVTSPAAAAMEQEEEEAHFHPDLSVSGYSGVSGRPSARGAAGGGRLSYDSDASRRFQELSRLSGFDEESELPPLDMTQASHSYQHDQGYHNSSSFDLNQSDEDERDPLEQQELEDSTEGSMAL